MKSVHLVLAAALPASASAASFIRGTRVAEDSFNYEIDGCVAETSCSLYLVRIKPEIEKTATIFENKTGKEFSIKIENVPSGTYAFQITGGRDGKTRITTQFTYHINLVPPSPTHLLTTSAPPATSPSTSTASKSRGPPMSSSRDSGSATAPSILSSRALTSTTSAHPKGTTSAEPNTWTGPAATTTRESCVSPVRCELRRILGVLFVLKWLIS